MNDIQELIEYLKTNQGNGLHEEMKAWATAVEQLEKKLEHAQQVSRDFANDADLWGAKAQAYERILDKGITVNVYQDRVEPDTTFPQTCGEHRVRGCKICWPEGYKKHLEKLEAEDKAEKPFNPRDLVTPEEAKKLSRAMDNVVLDAIREAEKPEKPNDYVMCNVTGCFNMYRQADLEAHIKAVHSEVTGEADAEKGKSE